tara:strand:- start:479 stop:625 length:147 start_codon:yes stop_codon:yes gene_type:complete
MPKIGKRHFAYTEKGWAEYRKAKKKKKNKKKSFGDIYRKMDKMLGSSK